MAKRGRRSQRSYVLDSHGNPVAVPQIKKKQKTSLTKIHRILIRVCESIGLEWEIEKKFGPYEVDVYIKKYKLALESDGDYFHNLPGAKEKDKRRDRYILEEFGITTLRFPEHEILEDNGIMEATIAAYVTKYK